MANLTESAVYEAGIYQLETTDPVVGGANGISNLQGKQLANRTAWLKAAADEVVAARGLKANLGTRLDQYDAFNPGSQSDIIAGMTAALGLGGVLSKEIENIRKRVLSQGTAFIKNKYVVQGFALSKSDIRALHLSQSGAVGTGTSRARIDGGIVSLSDDDYHVSVPTNETAAAKTYYAYLKKQTDGSYRVEVAQEVPYNGLLLYTLDIPANDTAVNLNAATLTDNRIIQADGGWTLSSLPEVYVALPYPLPASDYGVDVEVESATDMAAVGAIVVFDKAANGFKIRQTGSADNVKIRWTLHYINYA